MTISIIAAVAENGVIGNRSALPWKLPGDLKHFADITRGHPVIMGRKTYESIGRPLPGRENIIVTRQGDFSAPGCTVVHSVEDAVQKSSESDEIFFIGGAEIYKRALPLGERLYLTRVHARPQGDAFFPPYEETHWRIAAQEHHSKDEENEHDYTFEVWERTT
jgi:dihydrofolate reductase